MKALEKNRSRRYDTANGLALDIQRYMTGEPVMAAPPSTKYRLQKFARKHRAALRAAGAFLLLLILGVVASTWQAIRATRAEIRADDSRLKESEQRRIAEDERNEANKARMAEAEQRKAAEANFQKARKAVDEYFTLVSQSQLLDVPSLQPLRMQLLDAAMRFYDDSAKERANDPAVIAELAATHLRVMEVDFAANRIDDVVREINRSMELVDRLRKEFPSAHDQHRKLAGFWKGYRPTQSPDMPSDKAAAFRSIKRLVETWQTLAAEYPDELAFQSDLAAVLCRVGLLVAHGGQEIEGIEYFNKGKAIQESLARRRPDVPEYRADLARTYEWLTHFYQALGRRDEYQAACRKALDLREKLVAELPKVAQHRSDLAVSLHEYGDSTAKTMAEAKDALRRAIEIDEALVAEFPDVHIYQCNLGHALWHMAGKEFADGQRDKAEQLYRRALSVFQKLTVEVPSDAYYRLEYGFSHLELGWMFKRWNRFTEAKKYFELALSINKRLLADFPHVSVYALRVAENYRAIANVDSDLRLNDEAEAAFRSAIEVDPNERWLHYDYGIFLTKQNRLDDAIAAFRQSIKVAPNNSWSYHNLADIFTMQGKDDEAIELYRSAIKLGPDFVWSHVNLARALARKDEWTDSLEESKKAIRLAPNENQAFDCLLAALDKTGDKNQKIEALREIARSIPDCGLAFSYLGVVLQEQGRFDEAAAAFLATLAIDPDSGVTMRRLRDLVNARLGDSDGRHLAEKVEKSLVGKRPYIDWCAIRGRWDEVESGFARLIKEHPDDHFAWYQMAMVLAFRGRVDAHRHHCEQMLECYSNTQDPYVAERVAKACLILPQSDDITAKAMILADRAISASPDHPAYRYFELANALANYRAGKLAEAKVWLEKCRQSKTDFGLYPTAMMQLLGSMILSKLGETEQARTEWKHAAEFCNGLPQTERHQLLYPGDWHDGLAAEILRREAERLFK